MNYVNYNTSIVQKYHVQLLGWPSDIPFKNPHQLTTVAAAKSLQNTLVVSTCKWVIMSKWQQKEHLTTLAADAEGGQVTGKKRKVRSDKGKRCGKQPDNQDNEDENGKGRAGEVGKPRAFKRAKRVTKVLPPAAPKSKELIDTEDDSEGWTVAIVL